MITLYKYGHQLKDIETGEAFWFVGLRLEPKQHTIAAGRAPEYQDAYRDAIEQAMGYLEANVIINNQRIKSNDPNS